MEFKKFNENKSAQGYRPVVTLRIVLAVALVLIGVALNFVKIFNKTGDIETCRLSLISVSSTRIDTPAGDISLIEKISCPAHKLLFDINHVFLSVDNKKSKMLVKYNDKLTTEFDYLKDVNNNKSLAAKYDKIVDKVVADQMVSCWYKTLKNKRIFSERLFSGNNVCMVCAEFSFSKRLSNVYQYNGDLQYYMATEYVPEKSVTYADFLGFLFPAVRFDTSKKYYMVYEEINPSKIVAFLDKGIALSAFIDSENKLGIFIVPEDEVGNLYCDVLVN